MPPGRALWKNSCGGAVVVFEVADRALRGRRIDAGTEIHRGLPVEGVVNVLAIGDPDVDAPRTAGPVAREEQPVLIA